MVSNSSTAIAAPSVAQPVSVNQIIHVLVVISVAFIFLVVVFGLGGARYASYFVRIYPSVDDSVVQVRK